MSLDDVDTTDEDKVPILCGWCIDVTWQAAARRFIFVDGQLKTCPECGREGCVHWCDGIGSCDWCVNGEPTGDECEGDPES
jgi:hypothetical protein